MDMTDVERENNSFIIIWADMLRGTIQEILNKGDSKEIRLALVIQLMFADSQLNNHNKNKCMVTFPTLTEDKKNKTTNQPITAKLLDSMQSSMDNGGVDIGLLIYAVGEKQRTAGLTPFLMQQESGLKGTLKERGVLD